MAIWYAKDRMVPGPVFGNMDYHHGLAVIVDTYSNHNGPHNVRISLFYSPLPAFHYLTAYSTVVCLYAASASLYISHDQ